MHIRALSEHRCHLGEGPLWDPRAQALYWVDSYGPTLYRHDYRGGGVRLWDLPGRFVGSLALRRRGGIILAMDRGFYRFDSESGQCALIAEPLADRDGLRFNDGKVDPFGGFVAGGMNIDFRQHDDCPMLRLSPALEVTPLLDGFDCFNGPCFSADGSRLYVTGRIDGAIEVFDYGHDQRPRNGRVLIDGCNPDGATVDADGFVWSAQWDDECLLRISPDGEIDARLPVAGQIVSSVMFGGPALDTIYVTTVGGEVHGAQPSGASAGRLLAIAGSGYRGRAEPYFTG